MASDNFYMMGGCHVFAAALHRLTGMDLVLVAGPDRFGTAVFHVACIDADGTAWDVRGEHAPQDLVDEQEAMDGSVTWLVRLSGEPDLWSLSRPGDDAKLGPLSDTRLAEAFRDVRRLLSGKVALGRKPRGPADPDAVALAADGKVTPPDIGREAAWSPPARTYGR